MSGGLTGLVARALAHQDPDARHSVITRVLVSLIIIFANAVLYGVYGVVASVLFYLLAVELGGLSLPWMFLPLAIAVVLSLRPSYRMLADYWRNHGHGVVRRID